MGAIATVLQASNVSSAVFDARGAPPPRAVRASRDALCACRRKERGGLVSVYSDVHVSLRLTPIAFLGILGTFGIFGNG
jgi:hypothetical protein